MTAGWPLPNIAEHTSLVALMPKPRDFESIPASYTMRAHSVTTNERARWPTLRTVNMHDMRHLVRSTGRRTNEGIQPAAQLIASSFGIGRLYSLICIRHDREMSSSCVSQRHFWRHCYITTKSATAEKKAAEIYILSWFTWVAKSPETWSMFLGRDIRNPSECCTISISRLNLAVSGWPAQRLGSFPSSK